MAVTDRAQTSDLTTLQTLNLGAVDVLLLILCELRVMNMVLADGLNSTADLDALRKDIVNQQ